MSPRNASLRGRGSGRHRSQGTATHLACRVGLFLLLLLLGWRCSTLYTSSLQTERLESYTSDRVRDRTVYYKHPPSDLRVHKGVTPSTDPRDATFAVWRELPRCEPLRPTCGAAPAPLFSSSDPFRSPPISLHSPSAFFEHQAEIPDSWTPTDHSPGLTITTAGPRTHPPGKAEPARRPPRRSLPSPSPRHVVPRSVPPLPTDPVFHSAEKDLLLYYSKNIPTPPVRET